MLVSRQWDFRRGRITADRNTTPCQRFTFHVLEAFIRRLPHDLSVDSVNRRLLVLFKYRFAEVKVLIGLGWLPLAGLCKTSKRNTTFHG